MKTYAIETLICCACVRACVRVCVCMSSFLLVSTFPLFLTVYINISPSVVHFSPTDTKISMTVKI